ncbi:MAG TPA: hypothetical protein VFU14_00465 [Acidimicrobiales bacterium]|nr:hypothetical protein [Acidimicrobiales bacterium]
MAVPRVAKVAAWAELRARTDGLRGSSSVWMAIWVLLTGYRYIKRKAAPDPVVVRERLEPGQQLVITHFAKGAEPADDQVTRRGRRRRRRSR